MPITNPYAVQFSNAKLRQGADAFVSAYWTAKAIISEYYSAPELGQEYTVGISELIVDGSETDGRPPVTGNDALGQITQMSNFVATCEANNNAVLNVFLAYAVNGKSRV